MIKITCEATGRTFKIWFDNKFGNKVYTDKLPSVEVAYNKATELMRLAGIKEGIFEFPDGKIEAIQL